MTVRPDEDPAEETANDQPPKPQFNILLTMPSAGKSEALLHYELLETIKMTDAEIVSPQVVMTPAAQTMYEDELMESTIRIACGDGGETVREASIKFAQSWCKEVGLSLHESFRLEFPELESWFLRCAPDHSDVPITAFSFGSFRNIGVYDERYLQNGLEKPIRVDFEHYSKLISIVCLQQVNIHRQNMLLRYMLQIPYSAIHSMVVDHDDPYESVTRPTSASGDDENSRVTALYLRLRFPPKISVCTVRPQQNTQNLCGTDLYEACMRNPRAGTFERVRDFPLFPGEKIGKCSVVKIYFKPSDSAEYRSGGFQNLNTGDLMINEIISRLKTLSMCRTYHIAMRSVPERPNDIGISYSLLPSFPCYYLLMALFSRGYAVTNQINERFLKYVVSCATQNAKATEMALTQLLAAVDEHRHFTLLGAFQKLYQLCSIDANPNLAQQVVGDENSVAANTAGVDLLMDEDLEEIRKNCVKVRKLVVTPTRHMLLAPDVMMSNRVIREFGPDYALRVVVRDEDGLKIQGGRMKNDILSNWIDEIMNEDYVIGDRRYRFLGWSNSQLRDHAFYMYAKSSTNVDISDIRRWMGDFTAIQNVPKLMSRMGQCFTQAQKTLELKWNTGIVDEEDDIVGGLPPNGVTELYTFSDGIGRISRKYAEMVCKEIEVTPVRSAYQIRYAGFKGMLSVDPYLDENPHGPQVLLRKSMHKFESDTSCMLEIVKYSQPNAVCLNRPLIMILDQVSDVKFRQNRLRGGFSSAGDQENVTSAFVHRRVCNRVHELLDDELYDMSDMLLSERSSAQNLKSKTGLTIDFERLAKAGFSLTTEPFFRSMLLAIHHYTIKQDLFKAKIEVPTDSGRTMYGILDTTAILQYGQIFVQYSKDIHNPGEDLVVVEGDVMVTKNPCIVAGDVRIFNAVKVDALMHLYDVIVFPQNGPRPHTDEMAGSDLDGDEYSVFWDKALMFDKRQMRPAMHYPKNKPQDVEGGVKNSHMVDFFGKYICQDTVGMVSIAHLVQSDERGIFSELCDEIAIKCSMAVDFPKTGCPALPLSRDEKPTQYPDYLQRNHRPVYRSKRLLGQIYRRVKSISDIIEVAQDGIATCISARVRDPDLEVDNWKNYEAKALKERDVYTQHLQAMLDQYGVTDEASLISGHMVVIRNRLSDGEKEDFSHFNTEKIIELRIGKIFSKFRTRFFHEFGGEQDSLVEAPTEEVQQKAIAWYMVTYAKEYSEKRRVMLSFPWILWDILAYIKLRKTYAKQSIGIQIEPIQETLTEIMENFYRDAPEYASDMINQVIENEEESTGKILSLYLNKYRDFNALLTAVLNWSAKEFRQKTDVTRHIYLARLLVDYCIKYKFVDLPEELEDVPQASRRLASKGHILLGFLHYTSSFKFRDVVLAVISGEAPLKKAQIRSIGQVAFRTYHHIALTSRFTSLHLQSKETIGLIASWDRREMSPVTVLIQSEVTMKLPTVNVEERLKAWSGVEDVRVRCKPQHSEECSVSAIGTLESRQRLLDIITSDNLSECLLLDKNPLLEMEV